VAAPSEGKSAAVFGLSGIETGILYQFFKSKEATNWSPLLIIVITECLGLYCYILAF
jgi:hypothetical protein